MSLLADLKLSYEMLADDPVEVGIHFGKSVLDVASAGLTHTEHTIVQKIDTVSTPPASLSTRVVRRFTTQPQDRSRFISYSSRANPTYTKRQMIGAV